MRRFTLIPTLLLSFAVGFLVAEDEPKADAADSYKSGGKDINVERYAPKGKGPHPAVLLVHGSDGMLKHGKFYRQAARDIAGRGYLVLVVRYFNRTDTRDAGDKKVIDDHFLTWMDALRDGLSYAAKRPDVDKDRIALLGYSLGAYLSLSVAASAKKDQPPVRCVIEHFGGLPSLLVPFMKKLPPVLILHGEEDDVVSVKEAKDLAAILDKKKTPYEMKLYPKEKHGFGPEGHKDARDRVFKFLDKNMTKK